MGQPDIGAYEFQGLITSVGGSVTGVIPTIIRCENNTTGQSVSVPLPDNREWDCEEAGLTVSPGDRIRQRVIGQADGTSNVGGAVTGVAARRVRCENLSRRRRVSIRLNNEDTWDCEAAGLRVRVGDMIAQTVRGTAE